MENLSDIEMQEAQDLFAEAHRIVSRQRRLLSQYHDVLALDIVDVFMKLMKEHGLSSDEHSERDTALREACELRGKYEALMAEHKRLKEKLERTKERLQNIVETL